MALERSPTDSAGYECNGSDVEGIIRISCKWNFEVEISNPIVTFIGLEDRDEEMSLDGMSCDSDSLAIQTHHEGSGNGNGNGNGNNLRSQSPDHQQQHAETTNNNNNKRPGYDADSSSSRPSVIETANKAPHHVIECT